MRRQLKIIIRVCLAFTLVVTGYLNFQLLEGFHEVKAVGTDHVVISEAYGGGGNSGSKYKSDFIELYNPSESDVD